MKPSAGRPTSTSSGCGSRGSPPPPTLRARRWRGLTPAPEAAASRVSEADLPSAYLDGLRLLGRRELSAAALRARLLYREHPADEVDAAIEHLLETRALDDDRVARA